MLPVKYNPSLMPSLLNRDEFLTPFSSLFDSFFNDSFDFLGKDFFDKGTYPKVDVRDEEKQLVVEAEIPGLTKDQVTVEVSDGVLRIKGEKTEKKEGNYLHRELKHSSFCRSFTLGDNVNESDIDAKFENGVLEVIIPKKTPDSKIPEIKKIQIK